jgi:DNA-binding beta-propeller fold protein YncE
MAGIRQILLTALLVAAPIAGVAAPALTPAGLSLTPLAATGARFIPLNPHLPQFPDFVANQAVNLAQSPDGRTLLVLTSGYNQLYNSAGAPDPGASGQYIFAFDITGGAPLERQIIGLPEAYQGIAFAPDGRHFYVSGGGQDNIHVFGWAGGEWTEQGPPIALGHAGKSGGYGGLGLRVRATAANLAITADGSRLVVANFENDTVSVVDLMARAVNEIPLRPGAIDPAQTGMPGGEYPWGVAVAGNQTAYVSAMRDREIDVLQLAGSGGGGRVVKRISVPGDPGALLLNRDGSLLFVACDNDGLVVVIDTRANRVIERIAVAVPSGPWPGAIAHGAMPNGLALSPDQHTLYVTDGGTNAVTVVSLGVKPKIAGLIPTGFYPTAVSSSADGRWLYLVNGKSLAGPNPGNCNSETVQAGPGKVCDSHNAYVLQLLGGGLLALPAPGPTELQQLTAQVAQNDGFGAMPTLKDGQMMAFLHAHIHHIIYIVRENRSYDQILGDLPEGNGDPKLTEFGAAITPNAHALARSFVDFDNFLLPGDVSGDGWQWSVEATEPDIGTRNMPMVYADRGLSYDFEGTNREINIALPVAARRLADPATPDDPNLLPGPGNVVAPDGPHGQYQAGYIWDAALRRGLSIRNYGFYLDLVRYHLPPQKGGIPLIEDPAAAHLRVAFPANPTLAPYTDPYFRGFDNSFPDLLREAEWQREFNRYVRHHDLPNLEFVRLMHDHLGNFGSAILGVNTPEREVADNDEALGRLVEAVAHSPYASSTLIFVVEDDAQDGPDHVDAHRSVAFIIGPYMRRRAVVSVRYSTVNIIRTMEDVLGFGPLSLLDANQPPMTAAFDLNCREWTYRAIEPAPLQATQLPQLPGAARGAAWHDARNAAWWAVHTRGYDWKQADDIPTAAFDRILWRGLRMEGPYPAGD